MIIREYRESDFESIKNWITDERTHAMWCANRTPFPLQKQGFDELLKDISERHGDRPFVAMDENGAVTGFFCYSLNSETNEVMLKFVMVDPARRGMGLGKEMLRQAVCFAYDITQADAVQLMVFSENVRARRCYEGAGFTVRKTQEKAFQFKDESWDRINMVTKKSIAIIEQAKTEDLHEILQLQYLAYQSEADLFGTRDISPLKQTLDEVVSEFNSGIILKMVIAGNIIGSVRATEKDGTIYIGKLMIHPDFRRKGYGSLLLCEIERHYPDKRYELFTSTRSKDNIRLYHKNGYKEFKQEMVSDELTFVFLEKTE